MINQLSVSVAVKSVLSHLILFSSISFVTSHSAEGSNKTPKLVPGEGFVVFSVDSNYPNIPGNKLKAIFKRKDDLEVYSIVAKRKGQFTIFPVQEGEYELLEFRTLQYRTELEGQNEFNVSAGKATYIGHINFQVNLGFGRNWKIETFEITKKTSKLEDSLKPNFAGPIIVDTIESGWEKDSSPQTANKTKPFKPVSKKYKGEGLDRNGLIAVRLSVKKVNMLLNAASLGFGGPHVERLELEFESVADNHTTGRIWDNSSSPLSNGSYKALDKMSKGVLVALELPPGEYRINGYKAHLADPLSHISYIFNKIETDLRFEVKAGEISYLGEVFALGLKEKFIVLNMTEQVEFHLNDYWDRDRKELFGRFPFLKELVVRREIPRALNGWEQQFKSGKEFRQNLKSKK